MSIKLIRGDITHMEVDAIVNPTDGHFTGLGGTDGAIHRAAGPLLRLELNSKEYLKVGTSIITDAYCLPCKYIIHTHGPRWRGGLPKDIEYLESCYQNSLALAKQYGCRSIAFPLISGGTFGFPNDDALWIAKRTIDAFLEDDDDMEVYIVAYRSHVFHLGEKLFADVSRFISENYVEIKPTSSKKDNVDLVQYSIDEDFSTSDGSDSAPEESSCDDLMSYSIDEDFTSSDEPDDVSEENDHSGLVMTPTVENLPSLDQMLKQRGETFACKLERLREERGMTGPDLYKNAWMHKSIYSKIINNINYKPAKITAVAFGLALKLPWNEFTKLLRSAGFALNCTDKFDIVIEYFVKNKRYSIREINATLFELDPDLPLIGC